MKKTQVLGTAVLISCALVFSSQTPRAQTMNDLEKELRDVLEELAERVRQAGSRWGQSLQLDRAARSLPISWMLARKDALELSPEQVDDLEKLRARFDRETIRNEAEIKVAKMELDELLEAETVDLEKTESKVRELERLRGDHELSRIRTGEAAKALLRPEQRKKLKVLKRGHSIN